MSKIDAIQQLIEQLKQNPSNPMISDELVREIVSSRTALAEFIELTAAFAEEDSGFAAKMNELLERRRQLETLGAYVEAEHAGADAAQRFPGIAQRIQTDAGFRHQYEMLLARATEAAQGHFGAAPTFMNFGQWHQAQAHPAPAAASATTAAGLWQRLASGAHRLAVEIPMLLQETTTAFGNQLADALQPQRVSIGAFRGANPQTEGEQFDQVLELPHPQTDVVLRVRTGPVADERGTLIIEVSSLAEPQPVAQARVTLRDADGGLLERTATGENGLALFRDLETDTYQIQVEHAGQTWELLVTLN